MLLLLLCICLSEIVFLSGLLVPSMQVYRRSLFRHFSLQSDVDVSVKSWQSSLQRLQQGAAPPPNTEFAKLRRCEQADFLFNEIANGNTAMLTKLFRERNSDLSYLVTKILPRIKPTLLLAFWKDELLPNVERANALDLQAHCAAMTALIRIQHYELAVRTYEMLATSNRALDSVTYICAMRAAGFCRDLPYILNLLDQSLADVGPKALDVAKTAIINLKYMKRNGNMEVSAESAALCMGMAEALYNWVIDKELQPDAQFMDSLLAVACVHGSDADCAIIQQRLSNLHIPPTSFTYNTLLDRCARQRNTAQATEVIRQMRQQGISPDATTFNTLLKLRVNLNDVAGAEKIAKYMEETPTIGVSAITKSLLFRLYRSNNLTATGRHSVESLLRTGGTGAASCSGPAEKSGTAETSAVLYATAIDACANASTALLLLRRAQKQHLADQAVFVAALKQLAQETRYAEVYDITHEMLFLEGLEMDKYTLSLLLRVSLSAITEKQHEDAAVSAISRYVAHCIQRHPQLLNRAMWNQLKDLLSLGHGELFSELLTTAVVTQPVVIGAQITAATATSVFSALQVQQQQQQQEQQQHASSTEDTHARATAETAVALLKALCWAQQQLTIVAVPSGAVTKPVSLHTSHFNVVLRMLMTAQLFDAAEDVYHLMRGGQHECPPSHNAQSSETPLPPVTQSQAVVSPFAHVSTQQEEAAEGSAQPVAVTTTTTTWQPSTFTIAELVRCGRQSGDTGLLVGALAWAMDELVYIPEAVISDVLSYLYSGGHTEAVVVLYKELYDRGHLNHWAVPASSVSGTKTATGVRNTPADASGLTMDLHRFNRAMAFGAIKTAVQEVKGLPEEGIAGGSLIIITGQNIEADGMKDHPYVLSTTVQDVLVEDFYPPISSSTAPGNAGRLIVQLGCLHFH